MKLSLTAQCVVGLSLGILAGTAVSRLQPETASSWLGFADAAIRVWTNALRLVVTPLVVAQLFVAISGHRGSKADAAKLGLLIPGVFAGLLVFVALVALGVASGVLALPLVGDLSLSGLDTVAPVEPAAAAEPGSSNWIDDLIPPNLFAAAARPGAILGLMLFSLALALAARRIATELQQALFSGFRAVRDAMFVLVDWLLRLAPVPLFALAFRSAATSGLGMGRVLLIFLALDTVVILVCILALYPVATLLGRIPLHRFARAVLPAQITAVATRSSLATVPVLLKEADGTLGISSKVSALVIPLGGATLKLSRAVSNPVKLLFLAQLSGLTLGPTQVMVFIVTIILLSPATAGLPSILSGTRSVPAYVAVGISPAYVLLFGATTAIVDVLLTVLNATGYMTANVLVARLHTPTRDPALGADAGNPARSDPA